MRTNYPLIAAAVAVAMSAGAGVASAGVASTIAQAAAPNVSLVIAGSSAAQNGFQQAIASDLCGGNVLVLAGSQTGPTGSVGNFKAFSCIPSIGAGGLSTSLANATNVFTIYYRAEGGSVVGALPIATGRTGAANVGSTQTIKRLNISTSACVLTSTANSATCGISGASSVVGTNDGWGGAVVADFVQLGVTDVEPARFGDGSDGKDYPATYSTAAFGTATPTQLKNLTTIPLFDQVFGLYVNTSGMGVSTVNLSRESAANIFNGNYTDWHSVPDALTGQPIAAGSVPITLVNREAGSGTRTGFNIYFFGYQCGASVQSVKEINPATDTYATGDALTLANATGGAITYASVDNAPKANEVIATLNGVAPSNLTAGGGGYDWWYEATLIENPNTTVLPSSSNSKVLATYIENTLPELANAPSQTDILAIPNAAGNTANVPMSSTIPAGGTVTIYTNPYSRVGNSCNLPTEEN